MKLYLVADSDLRPGQRAAQVCHAMREFVECHPETDRMWYDTSNTVVLLEGKMSDIEKVITQAEAQGKPLARFHEPDLGDRLTAIATTIDTGHIRSLRLLCS